MLDPAVMWTIAVAIALLPFAVTYTLNGTHQSDARGRRVDRRWQGRSLVPAAHRLPGAGAVDAHAHAADHAHDHPASEAATAAEDHHGDAHTT
jgi:hypothetical protein